MIHCSHNLEFKKKIKENEGQSLLFIFFRVNNFVKEKENVKTKYTKKQIQESIKYWENQLKKMNEAVDGGIDPSFV